MSVHPLNMLINRDVLPIKENSFDLSVTCIILIEKIMGKMMKNYVSHLIPVLALILLTAAVSAEEGCRITGRVTDSRGTPLAYANIFLQGTMLGTASDEQGYFTLRADRGGTFTLVCSYIGYRTFTRELQLRSDTVLTVAIVLKEASLPSRDVTVTASSYTASDADGVTLTSLDVVRTPGTAADIFWAVKSFPGLQQVEEGAGLFVRGGDVSETAVFLDGALINHPYKYESPTGGFFGTFSPFLLKGTYFSSGGYSAKYGHALSGVLAMESQDLPAKQRIGLGAGLAAQSAYLAIPIISGTFGVSFSGNLSNTKQMFILNRTDKNFSRYPASFDINVNTVFKPNKASRLKLFLFRQDDEVGLEVDNPDYSTYFRGDGSNRLYNLQYTTLTAGNILISANAAVSNFISGTQLGVLNLKTRDKLLQSRLSTQAILTDRLSLLAGLEFFRMITRISGTVPLIPEDVNPEAPSMLIDTDYSSDRIAGFTEITIITPFGFTLIPGLRYEKESVSQVRHIDPRISAVFPLFHHCSLTGAAGVFHQNPRPENFDPYVGNPLLTPMKSTHAIVGIVYEKNETLIRIEAYNKNYSGLLLNDEESNLVNQGYGYARGLDLFIKNRLGRFSGWISYSYLDAARKWRDLPVLTSPYFDITNNITAVITADLPWHFSAGMSCRYATGKPYSPAADQYHTERVPDYQKMDINLSWLYSFTGKDMTIFYAAVSNLSGRINIFDYKYSADFQRREAVKSSFGRSVYFGVQVNL